MLSREYFIKIDNSNNQNFYWEEWVESAIEPGQWSQLAPGRDGFLSVQHLSSLLPQPFSPYASFKEQGSDKQVDIS